MSNILKHHSLEYNQKLIGTTHTVLVVKKDRKKGHLSALTEGKIIVRIKSHDESLIGNFIKVSISSATSLSTEGKIIK